jgi:hypothetical protein
VPQRIHEKPQHHWRGAGVFIPGHRVASTLAGASAYPARAALVMESTGATANAGVSIVGDVTAADAARR